MYPAIQGYYISTPRIHADSVAACRHCATIYLHKIPAASAHPATGGIGSCDLAYDGCADTLGR